MGNGRDEATVVAALWRETLGVWPADETLGFVDAGGDSLAALELAASAEAHGLSVAAEALLANASLADIAATVWVAADGVGAADLRIEARRLVPMGRERASSSRHRPRDGRLFVTGATGFFGVHLLAALLEDASARASCLVRAPDAPAALARLRANAARYRLEIDWTRVDPICGDLTRPGFGLPRGAFVELARTHDAVYHAGAVVNMALPLSRLRAPNVGGTLEAVRLARTARPKPLHYISTLSVFVATSPSVPIAREDDCLQWACAIHGGYAQSKWLAEECVRLAAACEAPPISCYRLGLVTGDSRRGAAPGNDQVSIVTRGLARLGRAPSPAADLRFDVTPVDRAAAIVAAIARRGASDVPLSTYHVGGAAIATADDLVLALRSEGTRIDDVDAADWRRLGGEAAALGTDAAAAYLAFCRLLPGDGYRRLRPFDLFATSDVRFDAACTERALAGGAPAALPATAELLRRYVRYTLNSISPEP